MPWSMLTISNMLKNEIHLGNIIYNRRSQKLGEKQIINPRDMWIRCDHTFEPIISPKLFAKAQEVLVELENGRIRSDKDVLDDLAALLRKKGRLDECQPLTPINGLPALTISILKSPISLNPAITPILNSARTPHTPLMRASPKATAAVTSHHGHGSMAKIFQPLTLRRRTAK
jgi:hypothetical protein